MMMMMMMVMVDYNKMMHAVQSTLIKLFETIY